jgi:hypothetical protein
MNALGVVCAALLFVFATAPARAGELNHYFPGMPNLRDLIVPDPGFYFVGYNAFYSADQVNDSSGNTVHGVTVTNPVTGDTASIPVDAEVDLYALAPTFVYVLDWKPLGLKVGGFVTPTFVNASPSAALGNETFGRSISRWSEGAFGSRTPTTSASASGRISSREQSPGTPGRARALPSRRA